MMRAISFLRFTAAPLALVFAAACASAPDPGPLRRENLRVDPAGLAPDPKMEAMLAPYAKEVAVLRAPIGRSAAELKQTRGAAGGLGEWVADVMREAAAKASGKEVHGAFMNAGGVRTSMPAGDVSMYTFMEILPFDNSIVIFEISGAQLLALAEVFAARGGYFSMSGMRIEAAEDKKLALFAIGGAPADPAATYRIATVDYLAGGGDNLSILADFPKPSDTKILIRDAAIAKTRELAAAGKAIEAPADGGRFAARGAAAEAKP